MGSRTLLLAIALLCVLSLCFCGPIVSEAKLNEFHRVHCISTDGDDKPEAVEFTGGNSEVMFLVSKNVRAILQLKKNGAKIEVTRMMIDNGGAYDTINPSKNNKFDIPANIKVDAMRSPAFRALGPLGVVNLINRSSSSGKLKLRK
ncbi:bifunctional protein FolD [Acrasis kona]|uniref:FolD n=1 Tax=Acrasis kona TaxID=1008807 RepID=A0AAW2YGT9_9EUKA